MSCSIEATATELVDIVWGNIQDKYCVRLRTMRLSPETCQVIFIHPIRICFGTSVAESAIVDFISIATSPSYLLIVLDPP